MTLIQVTNLTLTHRKDLRTLTENFSFILNDGDKAVIIGAVSATRRLEDGVMVSVDCARGVVQTLPQ